MKKADKPLIAKRKHHHVWAYYLKRWSPDGMNIYYTTAKNKIVYETIKGVAMELDFYKLSKLSEFDIQVIELFSKNSPPELQEEHRRQLKHFLIAQKLEEELESRGISDSTAAEDINALYSNLLEDTHGIVERLARPVLDELANRNIAVLSDKQNMVAFISFFGHQLVRTKSFKSQSIAAFDRNSPQAKQVAESISRAWWFHSYMYGMNIGRSLYLGFRDKPHTLLINETSTPFITSDQPIINVHPDLPDTKLKTPPKSADFYYPISPTVAYIICDSGRFPGGTISLNEREVSEFNLKIAKNAHTHIFGPDEKTLLPLKPHVGSRRIDRKN